MRTTAELREGFLAFFEEKGHVRRPSASLIPRADDHTTLFISAGMQPLMPYFLKRRTRRRRWSRTSRRFSARSTSMTSGSTRPT